MNVAVLSCVEVRLGEKHSPVFQLWQLSGGHYRGVVIHGSITRSNGGTASNLAGIQLWWLFDATECESDVNLVDYPA